MPPHTIWNEIGESPQLSGGTRHSYRMTCVLTIRADGTKLPILFIIKGVPGGTIDKEELDSYPEGNFYAVQPKAWMDSNVWNDIYLQKVLTFLLTLVIALKIYIL